MKRSLLALALLLPAALAQAQTAPPATAPAAPAPAAAPQAGGDFEMSCALFARNADGSWHATKAMTLQPASGPVPLKASRNFRPGMLLGGFDLAAALDGSCPH